MLPFGLPYLYQVRVPGIATNVEVVVAGFLSGRLSKYMSCSGVSFALVLTDVEGQALRYFDARTNRPAMMFCKQLIVCIDTQGG